MPEGARTSCGQSTTATPELLNLDSGQPTPHRVILRYFLEHQGRLCQAVYFDTNERDSLCGARFGRVTGRQIGPYRAKDGKAFGSFHGFRNSSLKCRSFPQ
jgi:hypothetical protein